MPKMWAIMDGRAAYDEDDAVIFEVCETEKEANANKKDYGDDCVVVEINT